MGNNSYKKNPFRYMFLLYIILMLIFALLYMLPVAHVGKLNFIDAIFLSTSGISVTGLSTIDVSSKLTLIGQLLLWLEIQVGGIGVMAIMGSFLIFLKQSNSLWTQTLMTVDQNQNKYHNIQNMMVFIFVFSAIVQLIGFLFFLPILYLRNGDISTSIVQALFHTAASFTNAGFDLFGNSLLGFQENRLFLFVTSVLIILGVIGFPTLLEVFLSRSKKWSLFTKINVFMQAALLAIGFLYFLFNEFLFHSYLSTSGKLMNAWFLSATSRNGGLTTVDISSLHISSILFVIFLMFVGGSPSSCAGGIRTTTFAAILSSIFSPMFGWKKPVLFGRRLNEQDVERSQLLFFGFVFFIFFTVILLSRFESHNILALTFEVTSAMTTTGLSMGITPNLSPFSKLWLSFLMIVGRIGMLVFLYGAFQKRQKRIQYMEEDIIIG
ncbi:ATPase [Bacillus sp. HMF5848]|uniref:TrkH family potassium uptake protein n=1 Tax=Bacillus sp. HMF5848 TaxID=2495421 RepID=UPI000F7918A3|nr:potassium transporter TrkG [Bacillus sp. HMF5848]RSK27210.1 ATPase [Bacillus sp. HMF5848]